MRKSCSLCGILFNKTNAAVKKALVLVGGEGVKRLTLEGDDTAERAAIHVSLCCGGVAAAALLTLCFSGAAQS